ncbi:epidermal growth factor-like protein 7 [Ptychodera flava]|uniref:epidermal growth factor-like protein 7 n=1 Tax=Ptychodera flava TaxID=63121 RepID=UPI00396A5CB9
MYNMKYVRGVLPLMLVLIMEFNGGVYSHLETHVCTRYTQGSDHGTRSTQTSEKYQTSCGFWGWGRCNRYRAKYRTAYITTYKTVPIRECCSGWQNMQGGRCVTAICNPHCENGGSCVAPNSCRCTPNFTGRRCETVVDYCQNSRCERFCVNVPGRAICYCDIGYYLTEDGLSCAVRNG